MSERVNIAEIRARDAYLCFCNQISAGAFQNAAILNPDATFDELCAETGLGTMCTSCLLNAETEFSAARVRTNPARDARRRHRRVRFSRQDVYRVFDRLAPRIPIRLRGIIPVFGGVGVRTILSIANSLPPVVGARSPDFDVSVLCRDSGGYPCFRHEERVPVGGRLDLDISDGLASGNYGVHGATRIDTGSCWLSYKACAEGYRGSIRPHFKVETAAAVGSVHSINRGHRSMAVTTIAENPDETQFISAVNCTTQEVTFDVDVESHRFGARRETVEIPPRGTVLHRLPLRQLSDEVQREPLRVTARSSGDVRWHFVVAAGNPPRISMDHV